MDIRDLIVQNLINEIVGPNPNPAYTDPETGEERLLKLVHGSPTQRYGAGMLYPQGQVNIGVINSSTSSSDIPNMDELEIETKKLDELKITDNDEDELEEEPISLANQFFPSAMGFTVRFSNFQLSSPVRILIAGSKYVKGIGQLPKKIFDNETQTVIDKLTPSGNQVLSDYWTRRPFKIEPFEINLSKLLESDNPRVLSREINEDIEFEIYNRSSKIDRDEKSSTLTFVIVNKNIATQSGVDNIIFQCSLKLETDNNDLIIPYKEKHSSNDTEEEQEMNLLYKNKRVFGIGHGTSVKWSSLTGNKNITSIETSIIPQYDMPQIAPTNRVELGMFNLSDYGNWNNALISLSNLCDGYEKWIEELKSALTDDSNSHYKNAIINNINKCIESANRIRSGYNLLKNADEGSNIVKSFKWMNRAMIWQQQRSKSKLVNWDVTKQNNQQLISLSNPNYFETIEEYSKNGFGKWRPFQLAFILMNLSSIVEEDSKEREIVDLIWFPTGGGKTEAYLGLSAFTIFYRRLCGTSNWNEGYYGGTSIIMRYTLRLLTTQQYERASSLICACELIRKENEDQLGSERITIGLWVGGDTTPNDNAKARSEFNALNDFRQNRSYNFVVMKCPCCGTQIGKVTKGKTRGLKKEDGNNGKVHFCCENNICEFYEQELPLKVVDEYIYDTPPTLLLATVDKFAMIPWKKEAGKLFGFRFEGSNNCNARIKPPDLIIQDELHLISGPLGTMVGLYETMVQTLCNNYNLSTAPFIANNSNYTPPKIVASSATISRAYEQVNALYAINSKEKLNIFPAQGIKFGETWFSEEKDLTDPIIAKEFPSRRYVGILASGFPSAQTSIVRAYSSVLQTIAENKTVSNIDYYWTLIGYFNSIRELGGARSLLAGDIVERLGQIQNMNLTPKDLRRYLNKISELTSQVSSSEIPKNLKDIETSYSNTSNKAIDVCLATNMLATGVDISRLGLMFIHGQPKTSAEYIQASSRVGRDAKNGPGLVFTLYNPSKPRDKSQYEQFQGYHSRIYSNVEPTSVTPFSINARSKAIHSILIGLVRHFSSSSMRNNPSITNEFENLIKIIKNIILERVARIDLNEKQQTENLIDTVINFWKRGFQHYGDAANNGAMSGSIPLMFASSAEVPEHILINKSSIPTPTSMRGVDTESNFRIV